MDTMMKIIRINAYIQRKLGTVVLNGRDVVCVALDQSYALEGEGEAEIALTDEQIDALWHQTLGSPSAVQPVPEKSGNPLEKAAQRINTWLRYHSDYQVQINFLSLYACIDVRIEREGKLVKSWIGATLEKRLNEVIQFLEIETWEKAK